MSRVNIENIDLGKLGSELERYENQWIAVSDENRIVGNGRSYQEALERAGDAEHVAMFKVPSLNVSLAP